MRHFVLVFVLLDVCPTSLNRDSLLVCSGLTWTSWDTVPNNSSMAACEGQDVELYWLYHLRPSEHVQTVEWFYEPLGNVTDDQFLGILIGNKVVRSPNFTMQMELVPNAGLRLLNVSMKDSGVYSVRVTVNMHGHLETYTQRVYVNVKDAASMTTDGQLHATLETGSQSSATNATQGQLILSCGQFQPDWAPNVGVVFTMPSGQVIPSTSFENGRYRLELPDTADNGVYTCSIDGSSSAGRCVATRNQNTGSHILTPASVTIDASQAKLAMLEGQIQALTSQAGLLQALEHQLNQLVAQNGLMQAEIQDLKTNNSHLAGEMSSLRNENDRLKQQLEEASTSIAFHARKTSNLPTLSVGDIVDFQDVLTNEGGAFDGTTGIFTAPVNGSYDFHVTIVLDPTSPERNARHVKLMVDNTWVAVASSSFETHFEMGSAHAVVHLNAGQEVYVVSDNDGTQFIGTDNTFSGALLHADLTK